MNGKTHHVPDWELSTVHTQYDRNTKYQWEFLWILTNLWILNFILKRKCSVKAMGSLKQ